MPKLNQPSELEKSVRDAATVPEPDAEFVHSLRARFITEGHASANKNQETQMRQKTFSQRLSWVLAVLVLVTLVVLSTQPTVVNALKRLFGYVPNVGIVDQSTPVRMLTEPVTVIREGFTVAAEQVVLNDEKSIVVYSYILPPDYVYPEHSVSTTREPFLTLPDGTRLDIVLARQVASSDCPQCYLRYLMEFPPIPTDVNEATLEIPDLVNIPDNTAPQDWKIQLKFKHAGPDDIAPVIEQIVTPVPTTVSTDAPTQSINTYGITNTLDKFVALPDGYILYGNTAWTDPVIPPYGVSSQLAGIKDTNGMEIPFDYADMNMYSEPGELRVYWAYKVGTDFKVPLTLSFAMLASLPADGGSFTFDPGPNPQLGQKWDINQDVTVNHEVIHVLTAEQAGIEPGFFMFSMESDSNITGAMLTDLAHPPLGGGGGGGGIPSAGAPFNSGFGYQVPIPQGPLTLTFTNVQLLIPGDWTLTWSP
jgi:hypothetical protein